MHSIQATTVDQGLYRALTLVNEVGVTTDSRNGPVIRFPSLFVIEWTDPTNRVSFALERDANPIFHLFEALWMLSGRNDVTRPAHFAAHLASFSDDGKTLNGAYGYRWLHHFDHDQLNDYIIPALKKNPQDRRAVLAMWDGDHDVQSAIQGSKDCCCNLSAVFDASLGKLNMTVYNRSNDLVLGATGANIVHFAVLQEYVACAIGMDVGTYTQVSSNSHAYVNDKATQRSMEWVLTSPEADTERYPYRKFGPLFTHWEYDAFRQDINELMRDYASTNLAVGNRATWRTAFFKSVVAPVVSAFNLYKQDRLEDAISLLAEEEQFDWIIATRAWIQRRIDSRNTLVNDPANVLKVWPSAIKRADGSYITNGVVVLDPKTNAITTRG